MKSNCIPIAEVQIPALQPVSSLTYLDQTSQTY